jgi:3-oxoacyl-[acyl-carrier protein] reductase
MELGIKGKLALVTASSGGMGKNIAYSLAAEGTDLVLFARNGAALTELAADLQTRFAVKVHVVAGSLVEAADLANLVNTVAGLGGPDIVVLVTGRPPNPLRPAVLETEEDRWNQAYRIQLWSVIQILNGILPLMTRNWGRIIAVTSASAKQPMPRHALSTVFRAGVTAYLKGLATEIGARGITVNCVAPALIDTSHRVGASAYTPEQSRERMSLTPLGRLGTQEELCGVVTFLASRQAGFITGSTIAVEGGMIASLF